MLSILPLLRGLGRCSKFCRWRHAGGHGRLSPYLNTSACRWSTPQALLDLRLEMAYRTSVRVGVLSRQVMGGSGRTESRKEVSEGFFLFRSVLKCSAHRERIPSRSLMSNISVLSFMTERTSDWTKYTLQSFIECSDVVVVACSWISCAFVIHQLLRISRRWCWTWERILIHRW